ncbi:MAG: T9SS type A sorting domain-containing protein [Bacteroidales bacterium]|nr:T9SS type A sorting domain-containing protein [Bacteroidales bacterium]
MKKLILLFVFALHLFSLYAQDIWTSYISDDTTWTSDTINVYNDIVVESQATLYINPGVFVEFQGNYSLDIYGKIRAIGTCNDSIIFTINDHTSFGDTTTIDGGWGGIRFFDNSADTSIFNYCRFSYGKAVVPGTFWGDPNNQDNKGGAISAFGYSFLEISNSSFYKNRANYSGGGINVKNCLSIKLINNTFKYNEVYFSGGGACIKNTSSSLITGNRFVLNIAFYTSSTGFSGGAGGGLSVYCNSNIYNNKFFNNRSVNGALYESSAYSLIYNNIVANNRGPGFFGGSTNSVSKLINNTIVNNLNSDPFGCGIYFFSKYMIMRNNIVYGNNSTWTSQDPIQAYSPDPITADFAYSCNPDGYPGEGNIIDNPQFTNPTDDTGPEYDGTAADWSLLDDSPAINSGTPDTTGLNLPETDILGNPRVFGGRVDIGAYENQNVWVKINDSPVYNTVKLYPNPGNERMVIEILSGMEGAEIEIVDSQGKVCMHEEIQHSPMVLYPHNLVAGIYFYRVYNETGILQSGKWVKR